MSRRITVTKFTIVLDLDETLIHTYRDPVKDGEYTVELGEPGNYIYYSGTLRYGLHDFLVFCFMYFKNVIVWSAGTKEYVYEICDIIFKDIPYTPDKILTYDDIVIYDDSGEYYKPLSKIFNSKITRHNTYFIDDRGENFIEDIDNGITIPPYTGEQDICLLKLKNWFLQDHIVGMDVININNEDWKKIHPERNILWNSDFV